MTLSLKLLDSDSPQRHQLVAPAAFLLSGLTAFFLGLCFVIGGAVLSVVAWCISDDPLQHVATWLMGLLFPCLGLAAYCLDRFESYKSH